MKIQVIAEGSTPEQRVKGEWGLSMLIDGNILFDTFGYPEILEKNIRQSGVEMRKIKKVVISHNHWDYVSGLKFVFVNTKHPEVYLPQEDYKLYQFCHDYGAYVFISDDKGGEKEGFRFTGAIKAKLKGDSFVEQGLIIEGKKGPVLVVGCSHPGILKMVIRAKKLLQKPVYTVIGGLHLKDASSKRILKTAMSLKKTGRKRGCCRPLHRQGSLWGVKEELRPQFSKS
ncbi:MAG TPA: MBL fold metallo-hydrolase [Firmicutes bacterium]|nr:MBL fold metallo-hydrolase [Bacillota bacterium]